MSCVFAQECSRWCVFIFFKRCTLRRMCKVLITVSAECVTCLSGSMTNWSILPDRDVLGLPIP